MSFFENCRAITATAGAAVLIGRFVRIDSTGKASHVGTAQAIVDGICGMSEPTVGHTFPMIIADGCIAKVEAGAAVNVGDLIASDNVGRAIPFVDAAGNVAVGECVANPAAGAGTFVSIQFLHKKTGAGT